MTTTLSAAALWMPHLASVAVPAPLAHGVKAEPCTAAMRTMHAPREATLGGSIILPAIGGRRDSDRSDRFSGSTRPVNGGTWQGQDQARLAGGGPLRA